MMLIIGCSKDPNINQIKADLIGQTIGEFLNNYKFNSLEGIQEFIINNKNKQGNIIEYDVSLRMSDTIGKKYRANILIVYRKAEKSWKIASISTKLFENLSREIEINSGRTAIDSVRESYRIHIQKYGNTKGFSAKNAIKGSELDWWWEIEVIGSPPTKYIATSTSDFPHGVGKQVWFDVEDRTYRGYGIDEDYDEWFDE